MAELNVRVTPKASRNRIEWGTPTKVWVTVLPVDRAANEAVCALLAKALNVPKTSVSVQKGHSSRDKLIAFSTLPIIELSELENQPKLL